MKNNGINANTSYSQIKEVTSRTVQYTAVEK